MKKRNKLSEKSDEGWGGKGSDFFWENWSRRLNEKYHCKKYLETADKMRKTKSKEKSNLNENNLLIFKQFVNSLSMLPPFVELKAENIKKILSNEYFDYYKNKNDFYRFSYYQPDHGVDYDFPIQLIAEFDRGYGWLPVGKLNRVPKELPNWKPKYKKENMRKINKNKFILDDNTKFSQLSQIVFKTLDMLNVEVYEDFTQVGGEILNIRFKRK